MTLEPRARRWKYIPIDRAPMTGEEPFKGVDARVIDFWRWGAGDLMTNTARGILAEFLVAKAVGDERAARVEWDNFDVLSRDGIKIEVKSSAYLQAWPQDRLSRPAFSGLRARSWDPATGEWSQEPEVRADVYVFALHTCRTHDLYDPLDVDQWEFCVLPAQMIRDYAGKSFGIAFLDKWAPRRWKWTELHDAVIAAHRSSDSVKSP